MLLQVDGDVTYKKLYGVIYTLSFLAPSKKESCKQPIACKWTSERLLINIFTLFSQYIFVICHIFHMRWNNSTQACEEYAYFIKYDCHSIVTTMASSTAIRVSSTLMFESLRVSVLPTPPPPDLNPDKVSQCNQSYRMNTRTAHTFCNEFFPHSIIRDWFAIHSDFSIFVFSKDLNILWCCQYYLSLSVRCRAPRLAIQTACSSTLLCKIANIFFLPFLYFYFKSNPCVLGLRQQLMRRCTTSPTLFRMWRNHYSTRSLQLILTLLSDHAVRFHRWWFFLA